LHSIPSGVSILNTIMKVILIGATGVLGKIILLALKNHRHEVVTVSRKGNTDYNADISDSAQIKKLFDDVGSFDTLINAAGHCWIGPFEEMTEENIYFGIKNKMMGQINLIMIGKDYISKGGSFTLTSGFISDDPIKGASNYAMVNGAIDNFVFAVSIELKNEIRINAVSPGWVVENYDGYMDGPVKGQYPVSHEKIAHAYYKSAFGYLSGQVYRVWEESTQYTRK
jgi:NAD(P)-dependent dehydrogenase (short-subunit alcohol dehydrogenase family)